MCETCNYSTPLAGQGMQTYKCSVDGIIKDDEDIECPNYEESGAWDEALEKADIS